MKQNEIINKNQENPKEQKSSYLSKKRKNRFSFLIFPSKNKVVVSYLEETSYDKKH